MKTNSSTIRFIYFLAFASFFTSCQAQSDKQTDKKLDREEIISEIELQDIDVMDKSDEEWKEILTEKEFNILREKGTEPRYSSSLLKENREGVFVCAACQLPLFSSQTKYKSGTGWPSFYDALGNHVQEKVDRSYGMNRTEVICRRCKGHLGHVFPDGPQPTGLRYCINGLSLDFLENKK